MTTLWPPLSQIRADLMRGSNAGTEVPGQHITPTSAPTGPMVEGVPTQLLLANLLARRNAARDAFFGQRWTPGSVVSVIVDGAGVGVLLDRNDPTTGLWHGWTAVPESDWAGAYDVLLEPCDEPFDPAIGVVQTWNRVCVGTVAPEPVLARLSDARMNAIRAVATESQAAIQPPIDPAPGRVGLREAPGGHTVLTGTPYGASDPRLEYQALYRDLGQRLISAIHAQTAPRAEPARKTPPEPSWWERVSQWFRADALVRPAFALLATLVVAQQWALWRDNAEDEVRFRGVESATTVAPALLVRWQPDVRIEDAQAVLARLPHRHPPTVLADGRWLIEVEDKDSARQVLAASRLVRSVDLP